LRNADVSRRVEVWNSDVLPAETDHCVTQVKSRDDAFGRIEFDHRSDIEREVGRAVRVNGDKRGI
jgi:hypothetical protein